MADNGAIAKRSPFMDQEHFDRLIAHRREAIQKFQRIVDNPATDAIHRVRLRFTIFQQGLEVLLLRYSRGEAVASFRGEFVQIVEALENYHSEDRHEPVDFRDFDDYIWSLWLVSLAYLLDVEDEIFARLLKELDNEGRDAIFERIVALRQPSRQVPSGVMYTVPYKILLDAIDAEGDQRMLLLAEFLKVWYKSMRNAYWYDSHKKKDSAFFGYWCLELAALVKGLGIDDRPFMDNVYYPRDLVR